jgi:glucose/arabinose dehydrogenase
MAVAALLLVASTAHAQSVRAELIVSGLSQPIAFVQDPSQPNVQMIVEQGGRIRTLVNGALAGQDFLNLSTLVFFSGERGLLGLAFDPDYPSNGRFYVNYTRAGDGHTVVSRYKRSDVNPLLADPASRFDLVWPTSPLPGSPRQAFIEQPFANHNGGNLAFGPDGFLYIGLGDGGSGNDPDHRAQNPGTLLGKMLRIDVDVADADTDGYVVPSNNPFLGNAEILPEIWAFGLRNPWRYSFDSPAMGGTGALIIGDVGQGTWEEVDYEPAGAGGRNYGWRNREGPVATPGVPPSPGPYYTPLTDPTYAYDHSQGVVITGGVVYRGSNLGASYHGRYFFSDEGFNRVWSIGLAIGPGGEATANTLIEHTATLGSAANAVVHFGVDAGGEIYLVTYGGSIYRLYLELTANGNFANGMTGWTTFATPDQSYIVGGVVGGVFEFYRVPPPPGTINQAVIFQNTGIPIAPSVRFAARFDLGNSSSVRKRISVLVSDSSFNDVAVCTFWLAPGAPMRAYRMYSHAIQPWANATISFYAATPGQNGGAYRLDNVSLRPDFSASHERTDCVDPTTPGPPGGGPGPDLIGNGSFGGSLTPWGTFGQIVSQLAGGVFEFYRPAGEPAGVVLQQTGAGAATGTILTATFDLGNSSAVRKRVTALLHSHDFSDLTACTFWLEPGQALSPYVMRGWTTQEWSNVTVSIYPATVGAEQWIRLDNVTLRATPGQAVLGTECVEPTPTAASPDLSSPDRGSPSRTTMALRRTPWFRP